MYLCGEDELNQLRAELMRDDNTSCTSSLATTVSINFANVVEDADELYLGAEANSFARKNSALGLPDTTEKSGKCKGDFLIAMKELYNSFESIHSHRTNSSVTVISTVEDLIKAREVDPTEFLAGLGFADNAVDKYKREVLSRFDPSPLLTEENNKISEPKVVRTPALHRSELEESITKTQEWLSHHHEHHVINNKMELSKISISGSESAKKSNLSKAIRARRKFTKSRQSSFDLLPKLKEEELNHDGDCLSSGRLQQSTGTELAAALSASLREKLADRVENCIPELPLHSDPNSTDTPYVNKSESTNHNSSTKPQNDVTSKEITTNESEVKSRTCKPLTTRMESFELEEINSNDETSEISRLRLLTSCETLNDESFCKQLTLEKKFPGNSVSDGSESSGFEEYDPANSTSQTQTACQSAVTIEKNSESILKTDLANCTDLPLPKETPSVF